MKSVFTPARLTVSAATLGGLFLGLAAPQDASACWWLFRRQAEAQPAAPVAAPREAPAPGPLAENPVVRNDQPAAPPTAKEECALENKGVAGETIKSKRRWVEAVYEMREKQQYTPPVLEHRTRQIERAALYQTAYRQVWNEPEFTTVCRKEWHPPAFKTVCREAKGEPTYQESEVQRYIPPVVRCEKTTRCIPDGKGGFTSVDDVKFVMVSEGRFEKAVERKLIAEAATHMVFETVQDKPGYFVERIDTVMVKPGFFRTVEDKRMVKDAGMDTITEVVEVRPGKVEAVQERVLVRPGHWEEEAPEIVKNPC